MTPRDVTATPDLASRAEEQDVTWPAELATQHADLLAAMLQPADPAAEWPEGETFLRAHAPRAVAMILLGALHPLIRGRAIAYLWREEMRTRGRTILGKASVAAGKLRHFSGKDFILEFNWTAWQDLSPRQRVALVDHELTHCAIEPKHEKSVVLAHDVEEFGSIVHRWGLWQSDLERFGEHVRHAQQLSLLEPVEG